MPHENRAREPDPQHEGGVAAIALTACAGVGDLQRAAAAGYQVHLAKPGEPATPLQVVDNLAGAGRQRG